MMFDNTEILGEKKDWDLCCKKCDYVLVLRNSTGWRAERMMEMYNAMPNAVTADCGHVLELREHKEAA